MVRDGVWVLEPFFINGKACSKGYFSTEDFEKFCTSNNLMSIAFQNLGWINGSYHSHWSPIVPGKKDHSRGPSSLWASISDHISMDRSNKNLKRLANPTHEEIATLLDDQSQEEKLSLSISLSLRNMDISIEQIAEYYNENLVNCISSGSINGQRTATTLDQTLYAHVHSFFMHLGAARDYLAAFLAYRLGKNVNKIDSMARLVDVLRSPDFVAEKMLEEMRLNGFFQKLPGNSSKWAISGWLKEASELRNEFMHKRPYGSKYMEKFGWAAPIRDDSAIVRYYRPIVMTDGREMDVLDTLIYHYKKSAKIFQDLAESSGSDLSIRTLTEADIHSIDN